MIHNTFNKVAEGDVARLERRAGIAEVFPDIGGHKPHVRLRYGEGGDSGWVDYDAIRHCASNPVDYEAWAIVLWTFDGRSRENPPQEEAHRVWRIKQLAEDLQGFEETSRHWALCIDDWDGDPHWLGYDVETDITVNEGITHQVKLENISPVGFEPGSDVVQASKEI